MFRQIFLKLKYHKILCVCVSFVKRTSRQPFFWQQETYLCVLMYVGAYALFIYAVNMQWTLYSSGNVPESLYRNMNQWEVWTLFLTAFMPPISPPKSASSFGHTPLPHTSHHASMIVKAEFLAMPLGHMTHTCMRNQSSSLLLIHGRCTHSWVYLSHSLDYHLLEVFWLHFFFYCTLLLWYDLCLTAFCLWFFNTCHYPNCQLVLLFNKPLLTLLATVLIFCTMTHDFTFAFNINGQYIVYIWLCQLVK